MLRVSDTISPSRRRHRHSARRGRTLDCRRRVLIAIGQILNVGVFMQLGKIGVFYGNRLGYQVPWCRSFPFSLIPHPQYVGATLSIWGSFHDHQISL